MYRTWKPSPSPLPPSISFFNLLYPPFSHYKCNDEENKTQANLTKKQTWKTSYPSGCSSTREQRMSNHSRSNKHKRWIGLCYQQHTEDELEKWKHLEKTAVWWYIFIQINYNKIAQPYQSMVRLGFCMLKLLK